MQLHMFKVSNKAATLICPMFPKSITKTLGFLLLTLNMCNMRSGFIINFKCGGDTTQPSITCLKLTIEALEKGVKYVQI